MDDIFKPGNTEVQYASSLYLLCCDLILMVWKIHVTMKNNSTKQKAKQMFNYDIVNAYIKNKYI